MGRHRWSHSQIPEPCTLSRCKSLIYSESRCTFHTNLTVGRLKLLVSCGLRLIKDLVNFKSTHTRGYRPLNCVSTFVSEDSRTNRCQNRNLTFTKVRLCWKH